MTSPITAEIVGRFIDATVRDTALADRLLEQHGELRSESWRGESLLRFLAIENYATGVRYLARRGWNVDEAEEDGTTPLHDAVRAGAKDAVAALLELGADPNAASATYGTPLHCAISAGDIALVRILLNGGAKPEYVTDLGETAWDVIPNKPQKNAEIRSLLRQFGLVEPAR